MATGSRATLTLSDWVRVADNPGVSDEMRVGTTIPGERLKSPIDNLYGESQTHIVIR
jgi:hypothetical protein